MNDLGINLNYSDNSIVIKNDGIVDKIPMKTLGATQNIETCNVRWHLMQLLPLERNGYLPQSVQTKYLA
jgi:hypothetical protein